MLALGRRRYTKNVRDLIRQQQETDRGIEMWARALGERAQGRAGLILVETLRTMTLSTLAELSKREEPATPEELSRLSLVLKRIEGTDKLRIERERAAKAAQGGGQDARPARAQAGQARSGRASRPRPSPPSARSSRGGPAARASRHIGAGRPLESCGIPLNPT